MNCAPCQHGRCGNLNLPGEPISASQTSPGNQIDLTLEERQSIFRKWCFKCWRSSFTPLVFSTTGGMGPSALTFYRRLADMLGGRRNTPFNVIMAWIRTRLSFALLRASIMCLRGSRVRRTVPWNDLPADVVVCEGRLGRS